MPPSAEPTAGRRASAHEYLRPYLRALWQQSLDVAELPAAASARPILGPDMLLLPRRPLATPPNDPRLRELRLASAAHAGAHLRYGCGPFARGSLKPVQVALLGLLEDARIEWLAGREFPGLRALWLRQHPAEPERSADFESLLLRLSRSLLDHRQTDPAAADPHPWVRKARTMFFADAAATRLALTGAQELRRAASLLGHDIGQMRLTFNPRLYVVEPAYRDDNAHLWQDVAPGAAPLAHPPAMPDTAAPPPEDTGVTLSVVDAVYPEWDRLIGRLRDRWVSVRLSETQPAFDPTAHRRLQAALDSQGPAGRRLQRLLAGDLPGATSAARLRAEEGDTIHFEGLIDAGIAQRSGRKPDTRIFLRSEPQPARLSVLMMLDASASTARAGADGQPVLHAARIAALLLASALQEHAHECAVQAFSSNGRHQVVIQQVKSFEESPDAPAVLDRAQQLRSRWSTRLGAAVRHASACLSRRQAHRRLVLLLSDGEPHDIDVHDPRYLLDDLRQAVRASSSRGIRVACINLQPAGRSAPDLLRSAFTAGACRRVGRLADFPAAAAATLRCA